MDTNLVLRDGTSDLTGDETLTAVKIGPMTHPLWLHVLVPAVSSGDVLDVELEFCTEALPTTEVYNMNFKQITALGHYAIPFYTLLESLQVKLNETDNGGPNFGGVKVWIDNANRNAEPVGS
jgi:hypothetical protein